LPNTLGGLASLDRLNLRYGTVVVERRKEKKNGRDLASIYADFVKMLAISLMFGLVSPTIGFVAAIGISCRLFALAYFVHIWELQQKKGEIEYRKTDAQGIPFRCILLVVFFVLGFFATPALITGFQNRDDEEGDGGLVYGLVAASFLLLIGLVVAMKWLTSKRTVNNNENGNKRAEPLLEQA